MRNLLLVLTVAACAAAGCGTPGAGLRVESAPAPGSDASGTGDHPAAVPPPSAAPPTGDSTAVPPPSAAPDGAGPTIDEIQVLRNDPGVTDRIKAAIARPCASGGSGAFRGWYPVYTRYADVVGAGTIVTMQVSGCADNVACGGGLAAYAYRLDGGRAERVFAAEESGVRLAVDASKLRLERPSWRPGDDGPCPSATRTTPLRWTGHAFVADGTAGGGG